MPDLFLLIYLTLIGAIFAPAYFHFRHRMTKPREKDYPVSYFTKKRIWKLTWAMFGFLVIASLLSLNIILALKGRSNLSTFSMDEVIILFLVMFFWILIAYGFGFYISGIMVEQYSMHAIRKDPEYARLKIPTRLIHGPVSHIFIYSGGLFLLFSISLFEKYNPAPEISFIYCCAYIILGVIFGTIYFWSQIKNLTWKSQIPWFLLLFVIDSLYLTSNTKILKTMPFSIFVFFTLLSSNLGLLTKYSLSLIKHK